MQTALATAPPISKATILLPTLSALDNREKLFIVQFLIAELSREENSLITPSKSYPVWSPIGAFSAAETLLQLLEKN
jgi:hypothetical protein